MSNQQINCSVNACRHNDQHTHCMLSCIQVGNTTAAAHRCEDTECDSFEE